MKDGTVKNVITAVRETFDMRTIRDIIVDLSPILLLLITFCISILLLMHPI